jgi:hypothetical protein
MPQPRNSCALEFSYYLDISASNRNKSISATLHLHSATFLDKYIRHMAKAYKPDPNTRHVIIKIESYEGEDTFVRCGDENQTHLFAIVAVDPDGSADLVDSSYRTRKEAMAAWPEAAPRRSARKR